VFTRDKDAKNWLEERASNNVIAFQSFMSVDPMSRWIKFVEI